MNWVLVAGYQLLVIGFRFLVKFTGNRQHMSNPFFRFKQFTIHQDRCAMKVTTDACLFGAWISKEVKNQESGVRRQNTMIKNVLDVGTGTGLLSLMLAQKMQEVIIDTIEIDKGAADQAKENIEASPWKDRITVIHADARAYSFNKKYDVIISNPPFYEKDIKSTAGKKNIAHHSEQLFFRELLMIIKNNLTANGIFCLLLPCKRNEEIRKLFRDHQLYISRIVFIRQSVKHDYFRVMTRGKLNGQPEKETEIDEIAIWDENQKYTPEFIFLLRDFYQSL